MLCPVCSTEKPEGNGFCPNCGAATQQQQQAEPFAQTPPNQATYPPPYQYAAPPAKPPVSRSVIIAAFAISALTANTLVIVLTTIALVYFERYTAEKNLGNTFKCNYNMDIIRKLNLASWIILALGVLVFVVLIVVMVAICVPMMISVIEDGTYYEYNDFIYGLINIASSYI